MKTLGWLLCVAGICLVFGSLCWWRDTGLANPQHDEVIALLASKGMEREYGELLSKGAPPFHRIVPASQWHRFTKEFTPVSFSEIRADVQAGDKHPPLAFWLFNRWLSLFRHGGYREAVWLTLLEILLAAGFLGLTVLRFTRSATAGLISVVLFLAGNSAIYTATWVRQYALFAVFYAAVMLLASEMAKRDIAPRRFAVCLFGLAAVCAGGMSTQYAFATMSGPIHLALIGLLAWRHAWGRLSGLLGAYLVAAGLFFSLNDGVLSHVSAMAEGVSGPLRLGGALGGVGCMVVPIPSGFPGWAGLALSALVLAGVMCVASRVCWSGKGSVDAAAASVVLAGMLGAGVLQITMVGFGVYPGWATAPNHLCAFWLLVVFAFSLFMHGFRRRWFLFVGGLGVAGLFLVQVAYGWHAHGLVSRVNVSYVASQRPDLVLIDNLARGMVLQLTDVLPPDQLVWVTDRVTDESLLRNEAIMKCRKILYLLMEESASPRKTRILALFQGAGWHAGELPVVHPNLYDAILLTRPQGISASP